MVCVANLSTPAISKQEDFEFKASLGYIESQSEAKPTRLQISCVENETKQKTKKGMYSL